MKIQLVIISSGPILVSDEEAELGDIVYRQNKQGGYYKKVIAGIEGLPSVVFSPSSCLLLPIAGEVYNVEVEMELKEPYRDKYGDMRMNEYTPKEG